MKHRNIGALSAGFFDFANSRSWKNGYIETACWYDEWHGDCLMWEYGIFPNPLSFSWTEDIYISTKR
jgi:hypothetical protein